MRRRFLVLSIVVPLLGGCIVEDDYHDYDDHDGVRSGGFDDVFEATIDTGETIETTPGAGAGAFVEYEGDGVWHVFTSCDTDVSEVSCAWDIQVLSTSAIDDFEEDGLEASDDLFENGSRSVVLIANTEDDLDGFRFTTDPDSTVRFGAWIDGYLDPRYIYWVGDGALHRGAPSNPIDLTPSVP